MSEFHPVSRFIRLLAGLGDWCQAQGVPFVVIGGVAASLQGRPRLTRDVDVMVLLRQHTPASFLAAGREFGFFPRMADAAEFAAQSRVLLLRYEPGSLDVDISLGILPFEEELAARATIREIEGVSVPVARVEDLLVMKLLAGREKDREDIRGLLLTNPDFDEVYVRHCLREFADLLETPELLTLFDQLLAGAKNSNF